MTKLVDVAHVQAGDLMVRNAQKYVVDFVDHDHTCYEFSLIDMQGAKVRQCIPAGESVTIEL